MIKTGVLWFNQECILPDCVIKIIRGEYIQGRQIRYIREVHTTISRFNYLYCENLLINVNQLLHVHNH